MAVAGQVVVTLKPIHALAAGVMAGVGTPYLLLRGGGSPHGYALTPSDARALTHAAAVFRVSPDLEVFLDRSVAALPDAVKVFSLVEIDGLRLHKRRAGGAFAAHKHGGHDGPLAGAGRGIGSGEIDTHIWLDPQNAKLIVQALAKILAALQPDNSSKFNANAAALIVRLDALDVALTKQLRPLAGKPYLVFHDAYQYFERRYGLKPIGSVALSPDQPAGSRRISALRQQLKRSGAVCVFAEPQFRPRLIDVIVEGSGARLGVLDPLGASLSPGPELYFKLMQNLANALERCLK